MQEPLPQPPHRHRGFPGLRKSPHRWAGRPCAHRDQAVHRSSISNTKDHARHRAPAPGSAMYSRISLSKEGEFRARPVDVTRKRGAEDMIRNASACPSERAQLRPTRTAAKRRSPLIRFLSRGVPTLLFVEVARRRRLACCRLIGGRAQSGGLPPRFASSP